MDISLTLRPNSDKEVNLNLQCQVKRKGLQFKLFKIKYVDNI